MLFLFLETIIKFSLCSSYIPMLLKLDFLNIPSVIRITKGGVSFSRAYAARVEEVMGRTGSRGEATQVRCRVLEGPDQNKIMRRNVKGPVQKSDILMLRETEIEARPLTKSGRGRA